MLIKSIENWNKLKVGDIVRIKVEPEDVDWATVLISDKKADNYGCKTDYKLKIISIYKTEGWVANSYNEYRILTHYRMEDVTRLEYYYCYLL